MRNAFIDELVECAKIDPNIYLVVGDLGYSVVEPFSSKFPDRFINAGVAEQNMMGLAAGLASEGAKVFVYSISNFPTFRCAEQIRNDVDYHNLSVAIVSVGGGLAYGNMGYSHHAIQDYGLMRLFPNMLIAAPADPVQSRNAVRYFLNRAAPTYIRLNKAGELTHTDNKLVYASGDWVFHRQVNDSKKVLVTTGAVLTRVLNLSNLDKYKEFSICSVPYWGMPVKEEHIKNVLIWDEIHTFEDHLVDGGFGSWISEIITTSQVVSRPNLTIHALNKNVISTVGEQKYLYDLYLPS